MQQLGGNYDSSFDVDKGVGTIVVAKPLDAEQRSMYNMTVEVTDGTNIATTQVEYRFPFLASYSFVTGMYML